MISTKSDLVQKIYQWLIRDQANDSFMNLDLVETYIQLAEAEFNRELKIVDLEDTTALATDATDAFINLPAGFRGIISLEYDARPYDLTWYATRRALKEALGTDAGRPRGFTTVGNKIIFAGSPQSVNNMTLDYYKEVTPLTDANPTNIILQKYPDAYLYGGIRQALLNLNIKDRLENIATVYSNIIERIKEDDKNARIPSGAAMKVANVIGG